MDRIEDLNDNGDHVMYPLKDVIILKKLSI